MKAITHFRQGRWPEERFPRHELPSAGPVYFLIAMIMIFAFSLAMSFIVTGGDIGFSIPIALLWTWNCGKTWFRTRKPARHDPDHDPDLAHE